MSDDLAQRWERCMMNNYGTPKLALTSGSGAVVTDDKGRDYVDFLGGVAVNSLGHAHPAIVEAVTKQLTTLGHISNIYMSAPVIELGEALIARWGVPGRVLFANSGAEANEAAFKIARRTGKSKIIAAENGFHGRTMGALAMTGQLSKRAPFEPMPAGVEFVPYGDTDALAAAVDSDTAAIILEPIQGEGGVVVPPPGYLADARSIASAAGALLIFDEIQTGIGRTGTLYAHQRDGVVPDVMTLAKGLGGGLPIGACLATGAAADLLQPGQHGTTFGGNPVCAAAALAVLTTIDSDSLLDHVEAVGKSLISGIEALEHPLISHVRGCGLLLGIVLSADVALAVETAAREAGYLVNAAGQHVIRLAPPLVLTSGQADAFVGDLAAILTTATGTQS